MYIKRCVLKLFDLILIAYDAVGDFKLKKNLNFKIIRGECEQQQRKSTAGK